MNHANAKYNHNILALSIYVSLFMYCRSLRAPLCTIACSSISIYVNSNIAIQCNLTDLVKHVCLTVSYLGQNFLKVLLLKKI